MMHQDIHTNSIDLPGDYSQIINLPKNSKILDLVRRNVHGYCKYTLIYQYDNSGYESSEYEILFNVIHYEYSLDRSYNYLTTIQNGYDESSYSIVFWKRVLTDYEKRELKIDHLLI